MVLFFFLMQPVVSQSMFENRQILLGHPILVQEWIFCCYCHVNKILIMTNNRKGTVSCNFIDETTS